MTAWTSDELSNIAADELQVASVRRDGTLRDPVPIWVVRHGDDLYVRSVNGRRLVPGHPGAPRRSDLGRRRRERRHLGDAADHDIDDQIDISYRTKYRRYSDSYVRPMISPEARAATLRLVPRSTSSWFST